MNGKSGSSLYLTVVLVVLVLILGVAYGISYSSMSSQLSEKNQRISELDGNISAQNSTITAQNSTIAGMKSDETNMSLAIESLQSEITFANGNYTKLSLLFSWVGTVYGIHAQLLVYNANVTVRGHQYEQITHYINPSNNTTIVFLPTTSIYGDVNGNGTSTVQNITYSVSGYSQSASVWGPPVTLPEFALYVYNIGTSTLTFNYTMIMIWK